VASTLDGVLTFTGGGNSSMNISASAVVKASVGRCVRVIVQVVTATAAITLNDCATTAAAAAGNAFLTIPIGAAVGTIYYVDWPCANGIVVAYGGSATGTLAVSYQ
jgi:hypothetical protein